MTSPITVVHALSDRNIGGAGRYLEMMIRGTMMAGLGDRVEFEVVHPQGGDLERLVGELKVPSVGLPQPDRSFSGANIRSLYRHFRKRARDGRGVSVVHSHANISACIAARLCRVPAVILTRHGPGRISREGTDGLWARAMRNLVTRSLVDGVVAVSHGVRQELLRQGVPDSMIRVIHNGIDASRWDIERQPTRPTVAMTGRLSPEKGHLDLLRAAPGVIEEIPEARFWIIGQGPLGKDLECQAQRLGLAGHVEFLGFRHDLSRLYREVSVGVSASSHEGFNLSLAEFMAAGVPVVATAVPGQDELVDDSHGLLVPPGDVQALTRALVCLLTDPVLAHKLGRAGQERVRGKFGATSMASQTMALYESVIGDEAG